MVLQCVHDPFRELVNAGQLQWLIEHRAVPGAPESREMQSALDEVEGKAARLLAEIKTFVQGGGDDTHLARRLGWDTAGLLRSAVLEALGSVPDSEAARAALHFLRAGPTGSTEDPWEAGDRVLWGTLLGWLFVRRLGGVTGETSTAEVSRAWIDEWLLGRFLAQSLADLGLDESHAWRTVGIVKLLTGHQDWERSWDDEREFRPEAAAYRSIQSWMKDSELQRFLGVNRYEGILWFNQEAFQEWLWWLFTVAALQVASEPAQGDGVPQRILRAYDVIRCLQRAQGRSKCQIPLLLKEAKAAAKKQISSPSAGSPQCGSPAADCGTE
jgi:hypothetical protein